MTLKNKKQPVPGFCLSCFDDYHIRDRFSSNTQTPQGSCKYCGQLSRESFSFSEITPYFEEILSLYESSENPTEGRPLLSCLEEDWGIFSSRANASLESKIYLLSTIYGKETINKSYTLKEENRNLIPEIESLFEKFLHNIRYVNRWFFPEAKILNEALANCKYFSFPISHFHAGPFYRGRIDNDRTISAPEEISAPPAHKVTHGRGNPPGIPYLYLALEEETAYSEIRPQRGDSIAIGSFELQTPDECHVINLSEIGRVFSPFADIFSDEEGENFSIVSVFKLRQIMERIAKVFNSPYVNFPYETRYLPTQYICEYFKLQGFSGVLYDSVTHEGGKNLILFDPDQAKNTSIQHVNLKTIKYTAQATSR